MYFNKNSHTLKSSLCIKNVHHVFQKKYQSCIKKSIHHVFKMFWLISRNICVIVKSGNAFFLNGVYLPKGVCVFWKSVYFLKNRGLLLIPFHMKNWKLYVLSSLHYPRHTLLTNHINVEFMLASGEDTCATFFLPTPQARQQFGYVVGPNFTICTCENESMTQVRKRI